MKADKHNAQLLTTYTKTQMHVKQNPGTYLSQNQQKQCPTTREEGSKGRALVYKGWGAVYKGGLCKDP